MAVTRPIVGVIGGDYGGPISSAERLYEDTLSSGDLVDKWLRLLYSGSFMGKPEGNMWEGTFNFNEAIKVFSAALEGGAPTPSEEMYRMLGLERPYVYGELRPEWCLARGKSQTDLRKKLLAKWLVRFQGYEEVKHWKRIGLSDDEMFVKLRELNRRKKT